MVISNLFVTHMATQILGFSLLHLLWSKLLGYFEPMPHKWTLISNISAWALIFRLWHLIPIEKRIEPTFRRKCKFFAYWAFWTFFMSFQLILMLKVLRTVPREIQWIVALILPLKKTINDYILDKIITNAATTENLDEGKFMVKITNSLCYSISFAIAVTTVTKATEYLLLGINFCINIGLCYRAIRLDKKVSPVVLERAGRQSLKDETITELILNEVVEVTVPLAFMGACFAGYHGPNKDTIGLLGCLLWHHEDVENFFSFIEPVIEMALLDFGSFIITGGMLWWFCHINIFTEYNRKIKKYWKHVAFHGGSFLSAVSKNTNLSKKIMNVYKED